MLKNRIFAVYFNIQMKGTERLLHYVWRHKLFPLCPLVTTDGRTLEVLDPGLYNQDAGPDFFNAKIKIDQTVWVGNVELHTRSSDWFRHGHDADAAYKNVILHVVEVADAEVGATLFPQLVLPVPEQVRLHYEELQQQDVSPACHAVLPSLSSLAVNGWLSALQTERFEEKARHIHCCLERCNGDWEQVCFVTLARNFGFGVNGDAFEEWAYHIPLQAIGKHRDNLFQVEAFFLGQAGLLEAEAQPASQREQAAADTYFQQLRREYAFLAHKFSLTPMDASRWRFLRLRPQNFPHVRLAQLADLYFRQTAGLAQLLAATDADALRTALSARVSGYWETHYGFGTESRRGQKAIRTASLNLLLINTVAPLWFAYGRYRYDESLCERAFRLWEELPAEDNYITRDWKQAGIRVQTAADSQAVIRLRKQYCDRKDCLRCRFGYEYLTHKK